MNILNNKTGQQAVPIRLFLLVIGIIIFFTQYPVLSGIIDAVAGEQVDGTIVFLIKMTPYIVMIALFAWILRGEA